MVKLKIYYAIAKVFQIIGCLATVIALILHFKGLGGIISQVLYLSGFTVCLTAIFVGQAIDEKIIKKENEKK